MTDTKRRGRKAVIQIEIDYGLYILDRPDYFECEICGKLDKTKNIDAMYDHLDTHDTHAFMTDVDFNSKKDYKLIKSELVTLGKAKIDET